MDFSLQSVPPDGTVECAKVPKDDCIPEQCQHSSTRAYWSDVIGESVEDNRGNESGGEEKGRKRRGGEGRRAEEMKGEGEISVNCTLNIPRPLPLATPTRQL